MFEPGDFVQCINDGPDEVFNTYTLETRVIECPLKLNSVYEVLSCYPAEYKFSLPDGSTVSFEAPTISVGVPDPELALDAWDVWRFRKLQKLKPDPEALARLKGIGRRTRELERA